MNKVSFEQDINIYILQYIAAKEDMINFLLSSYDDILIYTPKMEYYRRDIKGIALKKMFPGYLFIQTSRDYDAWKDLLRELPARDGIVRDLDDEGIGALSENERLLLSYLLDEEGVMRMSYGVLKNGRAQITEGPLKKFEKKIKKVDKHNQLAYLDLSLINHEITAGLRFI